ncbi:thioredoxin-like protein [Plasmodium gallinaceum]|uniref:Thioredoxin-like protein n=1 Tax=Plasmodium gallinaceum TaxID=5849 RepID=A0A1J1H0W6_PLAGA|nr:thioredoxin-like protein [Plasmodium gallinaceum]CRG98211.1 thioredoxin-like protein [Plasmodium gallinaceum]
MNKILNSYKSKLIFPMSKRNFYNFNCIFKIKNGIPIKKNEKINFSKHLQKNIVSYIDFRNKIPNKRRKIYLFSSLITCIIGYKIYKWNESREVTDFLNDMKEISDEIFDNVDNIVLFVLDKNKLSEQKTKIQEIKDEIQKLNIKNINFLYTYNEESKDYACYLYKGRRRRNLTKEELTSNSIKNILTDFFTPVSENYQKINQGNNDNFPTFVTHDTFEKEIIEDSKNNEIILVLFENTCFLCFLYKPFINTLHKLFKDNNIQVKIKKYNVEKNDYAPNMIVCRGTPTFLYYHNGKGNKLVEYKPNDIINKIDEIIKPPKNIKEQMIAKAELIHERMHHFGHLTLWMTESKIIENMLIKRHIKDISNSNDDESLYNEILTSLIEEDMQRNDLIEDSLNYTKGKIKEAEKSCFVVAMMMAQELIDEEKKSMI